MLSSYVYTPFAITTADTYNTPIIHNTEHGVLVYLATSSDGKVQKVYIHRVPPIVVVSVVSRQPSSYVTYRTTYYIYINGLSIVYIIVGCSLCAIAGAASIKGVARKCEWRIKDELCARDAHRI